MIESNQLFEEGFKEQKRSEKIEKILINFPFKHEKEEMEKFFERILHIYFKENFTKYGFTKAIDLDELVNENNKYEKRFDFKVTKENKEYFLEVEKYPECFIEHKHDNKKCQILFSGTNEPISKIQRKALPKEIVFLDVNHFNEWMKENKPLAEQFSKLKQDREIAYNNSQNLYTGGLFLEESKLIPIKRMFSIIFSINSCKSIRTENPECTQELRPRADCYCGNRGKGCFNKRIEIAKLNSLAEQFYREKNGKLVLDEIIEYFAKTYYDTQASPEQIESYKQLFLKLRKD